MAACDGVEPMNVTRSSLLTSCTGLVERVECRPSDRGSRGEDYSSDFQVAFPYRGAFIWHVGDDAVMSDPNQVLFVRGGEPFRLGGTCARGFGEMIITPDPAALRDASESTGYDLERHPLFITRSCRITPRACCGSTRRAVAAPGPTAPPIASTSGSGRACSPLRARPCGTNSRRGWPDPPSV